MDIESLRTLLQTHLLERGGGVIPQSQRSAARAMGITQPVLSTFLDGSRQSLDPAICIRIAHYMGVPVVEVLRMAGHDDLARILVDSATVSDTERVPDPWTEQFSRVISELDTDSKDAIVRNARSMARILKGKPAPHHVTPRKHK